MKLSIFLGLVAIVAVASATVSYDRQPRFFKKVTKFVKKTADKAVDFADDAVDKVGDAAKTGAKAVASGATTAAGFIDDTATDAAKKTAKIATKAAKGVASISKKAYKEAYSAAKISFNAIKEIAEDIDFDAAVDKLVGLMDSQLMNSLCVFSCNAAAVAIFGPAGAPYGIVGCPTLCSA
ncbi:hypothetical protein PoB_005633900 [Plakobranchus ocellatus]|uniref:Uncharacterized protein n=1 Tax=Plakobranchus ocellatus TaxID=259542 RepID=A0AAV4CGB0_9GAST|nr:hypothetical protein PoB_005633900 [Plakobranchus ocellatus]